MTRIVALSLTVLFGVLASTMGQSPDDLGPAPPPIPAPPAELVPPASPAALPTIGAPERPALPSAPAAMPADLQRPGTRTNDLSKASSEFAAKNYAQAALIFADAHRQGEKLTDSQRDEWAYCRLHAVAARINRGDNSATAIADLGKEVEDALRIGSDRLMPFGKQLLGELGRRGQVKPSSVVPGWEVVEVASFRVLHQGQREHANEIAHTAEAARRAMYERWAGPPAADWTPRCDIYLHATATDYATNTKKSPENPGHVTVAIRDAKVHSRRIDLRHDDASLLDSTLAHQVTLVILTEMFTEQPLPRWALIGMATLSESPESVATYRRAVPSLLHAKKLFAVGPFMEKAEFPAAEHMTPFYAESVSLVSYLVELRGPKAFAAFLREAPRRGISKALASHYEIKSPAELQDRWVKHSLGGDAGR